MTMPRYIDAERFKLWLQENYVLYDGDRYFNDIDAQPTADVVSKEDAINELTKEISDRIIQALEANYEIIPKKPVVRCKDCKHSSWDELGKCYWCKGKERTADFFCADGERRTDDD